MTHPTIQPPAGWPPLPYDAWRDTLDTVHMWTQIVGKTRMALAPWLNQWWQVTLTVDARGLTTGPMPVGDRNVEVAFDFVDHNLVIRASDGRLKALPLASRPVAAFYAEFLLAMNAIGVAVEINPTPCEVPDPIRFDDDTIHASYDPDAVRRWWSVLVSTERVMQRWRSSFVGKASPPLFYWGSFDLNATRFSGRPADPPAGAPRFFQLAENEENVSCGFWPGNVSASGLLLGAPAFYAYAYPEPPGFRAAVVRPADATWDATFGEFLLPYDAVQREPDPDAAVLAFFQSVYEAATDAGKWDRARLEQPVPVFRRREADRHPGPA